MRKFAFYFAPVLLLGTVVADAVAQNRPPNIVVISCDDLGYGDLGCSGHPTIRTPQLDRMAAEGQRWTSFYTASSVCSPSRAALLTGRLPIRSGMYGNRNRVFGPSSVGGLPDSEWTMAEALRSAGYLTVCIGKWHLGHQPHYLPHRRGFDSYFGIPYSNDMSPTFTTPLAYVAPRIEYWNVPLLRDGNVIEVPADQRTITSRYTDEVVRFIQSHDDEPFFVYLAHTMPHVPLFRSQPFEEVSERGRYGDVVEELDFSVGRVLDTLRAEGIERDTLVVFTSDNGPWLSFGAQGGSAGLLRGGKGDTFEGGMRVPAIFWWPGTIEPGVVSDMGSTMDLLPSFCRLADVHVPAQVELDGMDLSGKWRGEEYCPRSTMFYYRGSDVFAVRHEQYKAHFRTKSGYGPDPVVLHDPPLLFHLGHDPSEQFDVAAEEPAIVARIRSIYDQHMQSRVVAPSEIDR